MSKQIGWHHPVDESDQWDGFNDSGIEHFRGRPIPHLAREVNQNASDAGTDGTVNVKIALRRVDTSSIPDIEGLLSNLQLCAAEAKPESKKAEVFFERALEELKKDKIQVLEISDFNTSGMVGPCKNGTPFYAFMKASGQSRKGSDTATGSYGIGKFAPYAVSNIRTIFVSTVYQDDKGDYQQLTQGKSILMSHDRGGKRRRGVGFWGIREKCQPVAGVTSDLPEWVQRASSGEDLSKFAGSKISVLCFDTTTHWQEHLAVSIAENFFGAINDGKLRVEIGSKHVLDQHTIGGFLADADVRKLIENEKDEPEHFDNCRSYWEALQNKTEVIIEESEKLELGLVQLKILIGEGLPKKVCALRNGMFISDSLNGLKMFNDFKEFVAVVQCQSTKGNELLRAMEPPRHDDFEPERLPTKAEQKKGAKALRDLAKWARDMLKRHAKAPVSAVTEIDELRDFFGDEGEEGKGKGIEEVNPYGDVVIRAKPIKRKSRATEYEGSGETGGEGDAGDGGGGGDGSGGGDGQGGVGAGSGGKGGASSGKPAVEVSNVRAITCSAKSRRISFTPAVTGKLSLKLLEAGADTDYDVGIVKAGEGKVAKGAVVLDVVGGQRVSIEVEIDQDFSGAVKVSAHEV